MADPREVRSDAPPVDGAVAPVEVPAPLGRRIAGRALDLVVLFALYALLGTLVRALFFSDVDLPVPSPAEGEAATFLRVVALVNLVMALGYEIVLTRRWGATVGKWALGTRVVEAGRAARPGWRAATLRGVILMGPSFLPVVGLYGPLIVAAPLFFDARRRGLHDRAAGTLVVPAPGRPVRA